MSEVAPSGSSNQSSSSSVRPLPEQPSLCKKWLPLLIIETGFMLSFVLVARHRLASPFAAKWVKGGMALSQVGVAGWAASKIVLKDGSPPTQSDRGAPPTRAATTSGTQSWEPPSGSGSSGVTPMGLSDVVGPNENAKNNGPKPAVRKLPPLLPLPAQVKSAYSDNGALRLPLSILNGFPRGIPQISSEVRNEQIPFFSRMDTRRDTPDFCARREALGLGQSETDFYLELGHRLLVLEPRITKADSQTYSARDEARQEALRAMLLEAYGLLKTAKMWLYNYVDYTASVASDIDTQGKLAAHASLNAAFLECVAQLSQEELSQEALEAAGSTLKTAADRLMGSLEFDDLSIDVQNEYHLISEMRREMEEFTLHGGQGNSALEWLEGPVDAWLLESSEVEGFTTLRLQRLRLWGEALSQLIEGGRNDKVAGGVMRRLAHEVISYWMGRSEHPNFMDPAFLRLARNHMHLVTDAFPSALEDILASNRGDIEAGAPSSIPRSAVFRIEEKLRGFLGDAERSSRYRWLIEPLKIWKTEVERCYIEEREPSRLLVYWGGELEHLIDETEAGYSDESIVRVAALIHRHSGSEKISDTVVPLIPQTMVNSKKHGSSSFSDHTSLRLQPGRLQYRSDGKGAVMPSKILVDGEMPEEGSEVLHLEAEKPRNVSVASTLFTYAGRRRGANSAYEVMKGDAPLGLNDEEPSLRPVNLGLSIQYLRMTVQDLACARSRLEVEFLMRDRGL